jgi:hypothetical protein
MADVKLDGAAVGQTRDGKLVLDNVAPGEHTLEIAASGHQTNTQKLLVSASDQSTVNVDLEPIVEPLTSAAPEATAATPEAESSGKGGSLAWLGSTLIGLGAASAIASGVSMYMIQFKYNADDSRYVQLRQQGYAGRSIDACDEALGGDAGNLNASQLKDFQSQCRTARTFEVLQYVFLGVAVVAAGAGTFVLITQSGSGGNDQQAKQRPSRLAFSPQLDRRSVAVQATLRF